MIIMVCVVLGLFLMGGLLWWGLGPEMLIVWLILCVPLSVLSYATIDINYATSRIEMGKVADKAVDCGKSCYYRLIVHLDSGSKVSTQVHYQTYDCTDIGAAVTVRHRYKYWSGEYFESDVL